MRVWLSLVFCILSFIGCGGADSNIGLVEGTVTLDRQPVEEAMITFEPLFQNGSPSYCAMKTDQNGHYSMQLKVGVPGVLVGNHRVTISTFHRTAVRTIPEKVPAKYNNDTELEREVVAGMQTIDFDLASD